MGVLHKVGQFLNLMVWSYRDCSYTLLILPGLNITESSWGGKCFFGVDFFFFFPIYIVLCLNSINLNLGRELLSFLTFPVCSTQVKGRLKGNFKVGKGKAEARLLFFYYKHPAFVWFSRCRICRGICALLRNPYLRLKHCFFPLVLCMVSSQLQM